jgi:hypothetical protein
VSEETDKLNAWWATQYEAAATTSVTWEGDVPALIGALVQAQAQMGKAKKGATNPHFKNRYADLATVLECIVPALNAHGVALLQTPGWDASAGLVTMTTILAHETGGMMTSTASCELGRGSGPQALGSTISYLRRFTAKSVLALPEEDDDGNAAQGHSGARAVTGAAPGQRPCPDCGKGMWDQREGKRNPKAPDWKCSDNRCGKAIWEKPAPREDPKPKPAEGWTDTERGRYYATLRDLNIHKDLVKEYLSILNGDLPSHQRRPMPKDMTEAARKTLLEHLATEEGQGAISDIRDDLDLVADMAADMAAPHDGTPGAGEVF